MFYKIGVPKSFAKLSGKTPVPESFLIQLQSGVFFIKRGLRHRCFPVNYAKLLGTPFYIRPPGTASQI